MTVLKDIKLRWFIIGYMYGRRHLFKKYCKSKHKDINTISLLTVFLEMLGNGNERAISLLEKFEELLEDEREWLSYVRYLTGEIRNYRK